LTVAFRPIYGTYSQAALACYHDSELTFVAFVAAPEGLGGVDEFLVEPLWLFARGHWLAVDDSKAPEGFFFGPFLSVAVPPAGDATFADLSGRWVEVHGHFSDGAAATCSVTRGTPPTAPTAKQAIELCRTSFVVTAARAVPPPT
jgi:hypothetical protein